jgi:GDP-4-dehydro-6-deoxy-D-mannose reductase
MGAFMKRVLITGGGGFLGRHLTETCLAPDAEVVCVGKEPHVAVAAGSRWVQLDRADPSAVDELVAAMVPHRVYHLAAQSSAALAWKDPIGTITDNGRLQFNVLEAVRRHAPSARVLCASNADVYGGAPGESAIHDEDAPFRPRSPYAISKVVQDLMALQYHDVHGLWVVRVRPFLVIGPGRDAQFAAGSFARQIALIEAGLAAPRIVVGDIDLRRDMPDVRDAARALVCALESGVPGAAYNIATGRSRSLRDLLHSMIDNADVEAEIVQDETLLRPHEPAEIVGDATRLREQTGWTPAISFEQSARDTLEYWRERIRLHGPDDLG